MVLAVTAAVAGLVPVTAAAQGGAALDPGGSRPVIQPLPGGSSYELNAALGRLASNPADVEALISAGNAALALGDTEAALGFLSRADQLAPNQPRVKATLAGALVRSENPYDALRLFEEAERAGASVTSLAGDRGLAYDLVGANVEAQRYYRQALAGAANDEIVRRLALSLAIGGDRKGFEATLLPQLQRQQPGAWRARAFGLAILGDVTEAITIANRTMPYGLSQGIAPYLRYMPRLTPAQQAAAANFGHFPRAAEIGRDDPRAARYAAAFPRRLPRGADAGLIPAGTPLGTRSDAKKSRNERPRRERGRTAEKEKAAAAPRLAQAVTSPPPRYVAPPPANPVPRAAVVSARPVAPVVAVAPRTTSLGGAGVPAALPPSPSIPAVAPVANAPRVAMAVPPVPRATVFGPPVTLPAQPSTFSPAPLAQPPVTSPAPSGLTAGATGPSVRPTVVLTPPVTGSPAPQASAPVAVEPPPAFRLPPPAFRLPPGVASPPAASPVPAPPIDLTAAFTGFTPPPEESRSAVAAVDLSKVAPARPKPLVVARPVREEPPEPPMPARITTTKPAVAPGKAGKLAAKTAKAKPVAPSHPSRIWAQVATGRNREALSFDWRRLVREAPEAFKGRKGWLTPWAQTNRLLVGPFESQAAAQAFINQVSGKGVSAFVWSSPAGQAVDSFAVK